MRWGIVASMVAVFALLVVLWPNLVHEPLHWLALRVQGSDGHIVFGMHPYIVRTAPLVNIWTGLFYVLLPSLVSVALLIMVAMSRQRNIYVHFVLPVYLTFDLVVNVVGYRSSISDFQFLQYFGGHAPLLIVGVIGVLGCLIVWRAMGALRSAVGGEHGYAG